VSQSVKESVNRLVIPRRKRDPLPALPAAAAIGAATGYAQPQAPEQSAATAGIASPLIEKFVDTREYHPAQDIYDSNGTLVKIHPIKTIYMTDANGNQVKFEYGLPDYASIAP
jgi:hypothetical protein